MNILSEMSSIYYELTISEKRIAEYILEHTDEVQMMSISELAEVCHVGEARTPKWQFADFYAKYQRQRG